jgi:hypothetical protein
LQPLPDNEEFGSVEKLRAALKTPGSNPDDAFGDFTPIPTGKKNDLTDWCRIEQLLSPINRLLSNHVNLQWEFSVWL